MPTLFLAPTATEARRAAWQFLRDAGANFTAASANSAASLRDFLDPPLIFTESSASADWRALSRQNSAQTAPAPRLLRAEAYFSRSVAALSRRRALSGTDRLWVLQNAARRAAEMPQNGEWEAEITRLATQRDALRGAAHQIAALRRANLPKFPNLPGAEVLNPLLSVYNARLEALEAFDFEAAPALFPAAVVLNQAFAAPRTLLVDDLTTLSPALQIGLDALLERAEIVAATLICGGDGPSEALEGALEFWRARGAEIVRVGDFESPKARVAARILGQETPCEAPTHCFLTLAHTPREEMERIAAHIRNAVENGARPDDFALGLADFANYEADARAAFAEYGVPLDFPFAPPLRASPLVRALKGALDPQLKLNVHALHDLFGDGVLRWQSEAKTLDARRLRAAGLAARHPELDDLDATRAAFERKRALLVRESRHDDAPTRARIENSLLAGDLEMVAEFNELRAPLQNPCGARAWHAQVSEIIDRLTLHWQENDSAAARRAQDDVARFKIAVENVVARARGWDDERDTARSAFEWMGWLDMEIDSGGEDGRPTERGGVRGGGIDARSMGARATFWCGLNERAWPSLAPRNAATRALEQVLSAHQAPPLAQATHALARGAGENQALYLSRARYIEGQETPASPLLDDLRAAFPTLIWPQLAPAAPQNATRRGVLRAWNAYLQTAKTPPENLSLAPRLRALAELRAARREVDAVGVYDGVLGERGRQLMEIGDQNGGGARLSGSDLEFYARCPLRYFFERVLRLRHTERLDDDIDARAAGTLAHEIVRRALPALWPSIESEDFAAGLPILAEIAREECEKLPLRPILREAEWRRWMGFDGQSGPLVNWLRLETARGDAWLPKMRPLAHSENSIDGVSNGLEHRFDIELGGHKVKGYIDRIDQSEDGQHLAVLDYKTGGLAGLPNWRPGDSGLHFQLAIYALAVRKLGFENAAPRLGMAYISLKVAKVARGVGQTGVLGKGCVSGKTLDDDAFEAWLDDVSARAARIGDLRAAGVFNLSLQAPKDAKCASCASKSLCGQHTPTQAARFETHLGSPFVYLPEMRVWERE